MDEQVLLKQQQESNINVKEEELQSIAKRYLYYSIFYLVVGLLCVGYTLHLDS